MSATVTKQYKLNFFDFGVNSNKVWIGKAYSDGTFEALWGRVLEGSQLARQTKHLGSQSAAETMLENKRREKLGKGYKDTAVVDSDTEIKINPSINLKEVAKKQISGCEDKTTADLIEYLAEVNIHNITSSTSIKYDASNASFSTPLGVLKPDAISEGRQLLNQIAVFNKNANLGAQTRIQKVSDYFRLVPKDFGRKIPEPASLLSNPQLLQKEFDILTALESAFSNLSTTGEEATIFKTKLIKVPHWTEEGKSAFRKVRMLFEKTKNSGHNFTSKLQLKRLYEVEIENMKTDFERASARIGNVRSDLWHGTKASNLLSILKQGLIIPPASSGHCSGRMFGNGIYTSLQSTKALNYATNMWNRSGNANRTFMFLCDVALGKQFKPITSGTNFPAPGSDSTWVEPGTAGVMNHECIVYHVAQINLRFLCEFGE